MPKNMEWIIKNADNIEFTLKVFGAIMLASWAGIIYSIVKKRQSLTKPKDVMVPVMDDQFVD